MGVAIGDGRTAAAESQQFAACAFLEFLKLTVGIHLFTRVDVENMVFEQVTHRTFEASAGHDSSCRKYCYVAVPAVAAVVDGVGLGFIWYFEQPFFIEEQSPEVVFEVERCAGVFILLEFLPYTPKEIAVFLWLDMCAFFSKDVGQ